MCLSSINISRNNLCHYEHINCATATLIKTWECQKYDKRTGLLLHFLNHCLLCEASLVLHAGDSPLGEVAQHVDDVNEVHDTEWASSECGRQ